jgi:hypothetical protein
MAARGHVAARSRKGPQTAGEEPERRQPEAGPNWRAERGDVLKVLAVLAALAVPAIRSGRRGFEPPPKRAGPTLHSWC